MRHFKLFVLLLLLCLLLSSCLPGDGKNTQDKPAGFFSGFWHGVVAPISLIVQIFNSSIHIYESYNTGFWYDLGFWLAISGGASGSAVTIKASHKRRRSDESVA